jgi:hypothetical protein
VVQRVAGNLAAYHGAELTEESLRYIEETFGVARRLVSGAAGSGVAASGAEATAGAGPTTGVGPAEGSGPTTGSGPATDGAGTREAGAAGPQSTDWDTQRAGMEEHIAQQLLEIPPASREFRNLVQYLE